MSDSAIGLRVLMGSAMSEKNPECPICWRAMRFARSLPRVNGEAQVNVFECSYCKISFVTEDHLPISGTRTISHR